MVRLSRPADGAVPWFVPQPPPALSARLDAAQLVAHAALSDVRARVAALGGVLGSRPPNAARAVLDTLFGRVPQEKDSRLARVRAAGAARAQGHTPRTLLAEAAKHERDLNLGAAERCYEAALAAAPEHWASSSEGVEALCRLCKQLSDQGWHAWAHAHGLPSVAHSQPPPGPLTEGLRRVTDAVSLAEEAVALAPRSARAHTALAVASGRLALYTPDARARVALATRIRLAAEAALALDPAEDVAHHALGRWHFEVASLNPLTRLLARTLLGGADMARASHAQALHHYEAAAELAPRRLTHRAELGKALLKAGRRQEALQAFRAALACEVEDINALLGRMHAERLITKLRRQERREQREARRATALAAKAEKRALAAAAKAAKVAATLAARALQAAPAGPRDDAG